MLTRAADDPVPAPRPKAAPPIRVFIPPASPRDQDEDRSPTLFAVDRQTTRTLESARELAEAKDYTQAVQQVQRVLDNSEDFGYLPEGEARERFSSAKREALRILEEMPAEGRETYEREFGPAAKQMLAEAVEQGGASGLEELARRFFFTSAGAEATYRLGAHYLDHAEPRTAALYFQRLRNRPDAARKWEPMLSLKTAVCWVRADEPAQAVEILKGLKEKFPNAGVSVGGATVPLYKEGEDPIRWLATVAGAPAAEPISPVADWPLFLGNAARNPPAGAVPLGEPLWTASTIRGVIAVEPARADELVRHLRAYERDVRASSVLTLPVSHPLVVGDAVVFRTLKGVRAVRLSSGELIWESTNADPHSVQILERERGSVPVNLGSIEQSPLNLLLRERSWRDMTWGTLASDGRSVFAIEDLGFLGLHDLSARGERHPLAARHQNRLAAYELGSGRLRWEAGGPRGEKELSLAGTFFLGPPLPLGGELYCLGEVDGEVRLLVLDAETGRRNWVQRLMFPDAKLGNYPMRRVAGTSPSYADGILICPTTAGVVVALDLAARQLLWVYQYSTDLIDESIPVRLQDLDEPYLSGMDDQVRWLDGAAVIAEGYVLLTPRDSAMGELHCLNLVDGSLAWKRNRGQGLYVAGVYDGKVIVVGRSQVEAWNLSDGKDAWQHPTPIAFPSGRGARYGNVYAVPLSTGEIATINLDNGLIHARSKVAAEVPIGNLVAAGNSVIAQNAESVSAFSTLDGLNREITRDLQQNPQNARALAQRGEVRLHLGQTQEGLADLRRSIELKDDPRTRTLLAERLLDGLRNDFAANRQTAHEIEGLITDARQRLELHSLLAAGMTAAGERAAAWNEYLKLSALNDDLAQTVSVGDDTSARGDRWLAALMSESYVAASRDEQAEMERAADRRLDAILDAAGTTQLARTARLFQSLPAGGRARRTLVERLDPSKESVAIQLHLDRFREEGDSAAAGWATARLAKLLLDRGRADEAEVLFAELLAEWKDEVCLDGKTGAQLVETWRSDPAVRDQLARREPWPERHFQVRRTARQGTVRPSQPVRVVGVRNIYLENWEFELEGSMDKSLLVARDGDGTVRWKFPIGQHFAPTDSFVGSVVQGWCRGHLMLLLIRSQLFALDLLSDADGPRILWKRPLVEMTTLGTRQRVRLMAALTGPVTGEFVCFQVDSVLRAADLLTGEILWERRNIPTGSRIFGDDDFVFVSSAQRNDESSVVLRAADGADLAARPLPVAGVPFWNRGRNVLAWTNLPQQNVLSLTDAFTGRVVWQREFTNRTSYARVGEDELAVFEPEGRFAVLGLDDGHSRIEASIEPIDPPGSISVYRSPFCYVLFNYSAASQQSSRLFALPRKAGDRRVNGQAFAFDRTTGKRLWTAPVPDSIADFNQPANLPVVALRAQTRTRSTGRPAAGTFALSLLDLRNGRIIYEQVGSEPLEPMEMRIDRKDRKIEVQTFGSLIELAVSDIPLGDPPPAVVGPAREPVEAVKPGEAPDAGGDDSK